MIQEREWEKDQNGSYTVFCNLISEVTYHCFCHILLVYLCPTLIQCERWLCKELSREWESLGAILEIGYHRLVSLKMLEKKTERVEKWYYRGQGREFQKCLIVFNKIVKTVAKIWEIPLDLLIGSLRTFRAIKSNFSWSVYRELRFDWVMSNWRTAGVEYFFRRFNEKRRREIWTEVRGGHEKI